MGSIIVGTWLNRIFDIIGEIAFDKKDFIEYDSNIEKIDTDNLSESQVNSIINAIIKKDKEPLVEELNKLPNIKLQKLLYYIQKGNFDHHNLFLKAIENYSFFLSYCRNDSDLAATIESYFRDTNITLKIDKKDIEYWGSIKSYMKTIRITDYVILIITDSYLKSEYCMFEISELMKDDNYRGRIFPLVVDKSIYSTEGRIYYITYWEKRYSDLKEEAQKIKHIENIAEVSKQIKQLRDISGSIGEFLDIIRDMNNPSVDEFKRGVLASLLNYEVWKN